MSKGGGSTNTIQNATPWSGIQPYLQNQYALGQNLQQTNPITAYPGQTQAPMTPQQLGALDLTQQRALSGSPVTNAAQNQAFDVLSGQYLSAGNPYFGNMVNNIGQAINPQVASGFEAGGRLGSGAQANAFESALTKEAGGLAYQNYNDALKQMTQMQAFAPGLAAQDYTDIGALGGVGSALQNAQQSYLTQDQQRYMANQMGPWQTLSQQTSNLSGVPTPSSQTTSQPYFTNPLASAVGLGLGGLQAYQGLSNAGLLGGSSAAATSAAVPALTYASLLGGTGAAAGATDFASMLAAGVIAL